MLRGEMMLKEDETDELLESAPLRNAIKITKAQQEVVVNSLMRIAILNLRLEALDFVINPIRNDKYSGYNKFNITDSALESSDAIRGSIYQDLAHAYRDMFMFANLFPELRAFVEDFVRDRYIDGNYEIMHLMDPHGRAPGSYRRVEENTLKDVIRAGLGLPLETPEENE